MTSLLAFILWIAAALQAPQQQGPQGQAARDGQATRQSISGAVVPVDSTQALAFVTLKLTPMDEPPAGTAPHPDRADRGGTTSPGSYQVTSDALGVFAFQSVAPGRYMISADRSGYEHFQSGPGRSIDRVLNLASGQKLEGLVVAMSPVPTITGIVYNPYGQRQAGASVQAYRVKYTPYGRQVVLVATVLSHEGGEYRLFHLDPGYYCIGASFSDRSIRPWRAMLEITPNLSKPDDGYSTVYFPSEMKIANAKMINLNYGGIENVDIGFRESQYFKLTVKVTIPPRPTNIHNPKVALFPAGTDLGSAEDYVIKGSGGRFGVDRLAAGDYVLVAFEQFQDAAGNPYTGIVSDTLPVRIYENTEVTIPAIDPFQWNGRVTRPGIVGLPRKTQIQLVRNDALANQTIAAEVDTSGNFTLENVGPGTYEAIIKGLPANAFVLEARFAGQATLKVDAFTPPRTATCTPDDCQHANVVSNVQLMVTVGSNNGVMSGTVVDGRGKNAVAQVVFVPVDPVARLRRDRYIVTYSDASGAFQIQGIPPGAYTAYAFEKIEPDIYFDPDFNAQIARLGRPVTINSQNRPLDRALIMISKEEAASLTR